MPDAQHRFAKSLVILWPGDPLAAAFKESSSLVRRRRNIH
jgi:hypothetical protein